MATDYGRHGKRHSERYERKRVSKSSYRPKVSDFWRDGGEEEEEVTKPEPTLGSSRSSGCRCGGHSKCDKCKRKREKWPCANQPAAKFRFHLPHLDKPFPLNPFPPCEEEVAPIAPGLLAPRKYAVASAVPSKMKAESKKMAEEVEEVDEEEEDDEKRSVGSLTSTATDPSLKMRYFQAAMQTMLHQAHQRSEVLRAVPHLLQQHLLRAVSTGFLDNFSFETITPGFTFLRRAKLETEIRDPTGTIKGGKHGQVELRAKGTYLVGYGVETILLDPTAFFASAVEQFPCNFAFVALALFAWSGECTKKSEIISNTVNILVPTQIEPVPTTLTTPPAFPTNFAFTSNFIQRTQATTLYRACECNTKIGLLVAAFSNRSPLEGAAFPGTNNIYLLSFDGSLFAVKENSGPSTHDSA